jgi:SP family facilitated glucose transporter-like MFS transporter 8
VSCSWVSWLFGSWRFFIIFCVCWSRDMSSSDTCDLLQAKVGRLKESDSSLQRLRGKNADIYKEANEIRVCN